MSTANNRLASTTVKGFFWVNASYYTGKILVFASMVILARLLTQEDFGLAGYATVFINILESFADLGVGMALIYHTASDEMADTMFWLSLLIGACMFLFTWLCAPLVGAFFHDMRAVPLTRGLGLLFPAMSISQTQQALLRKGLAFGKKFVPDFIQSAGKGGFSVTLALLGAGAWSLVAGQVLGEIASGISYWLLFPWRPSWRFSRAAARQLLSFGSGVLFLNLLSTLLLNIDYLLVGRYLGPASLGVYTLGFRLPELLIKQFYSTLGNVLFPVYTTVREEKERLAAAFLTTLRYVALITTPLGLGLALIAAPFILVLFTEKWAAAIPVLRAISIYTMILSYSFNAGDLLKAQGKLAMLNKIAFGRVLLTIPLLYWAVTGPQSLALVAWLQAGVAVLVVLVTFVVVSGEFSLPFRRILAELGPAYQAGLPMAAGVLALQLILAGQPPILQLIAGITAGGLIYLSVLWWLQRPALLQAADLLRSIRSRRK